MTDTDVRLTEVIEFWDTHPCGNETAEADDRRQYFEEIERRRYELQPDMPEACRFASHAGEQMLEIGCGMGTDGSMFASHGADYVGSDLTQAAIVLARENFQVRGLPGSFLRLDGEHLPFPDASFDHVYSWGVIHHTPSPEAVVDEIFRVLRPCGSFTLMLYNRNSINYRLEIMLLRKLGRALLAPTWGPALLSRMGLPRDKLEGHRRLLKARPHLTQEQWVSMNTDGPDCPLARVYSAREVRALFHRFGDVETRVCMFDRSHWPVLGRLIPEPAARWLGRRAGWHRLIYGRKPA